MEGFKKWRIEKGKASQKCRNPQPHGAPKEGRTGSWSNTTATVYKGAFVYIELCPEGITVKVRALLASRHYQTGQRTITGVELEVHARVI